MDSFQHYGLSFSRRAVLPDLEHDLEHDLNPIVTLFFNAGKPRKHPHQGHAGSSYLVFLILILILMSNLHSQDATALVKAQEIIREKDVEINILISQIVQLKAWGLQLGVAAEEGGLKIQQLQVLTLTALSPLLLSNPYYSLTLTTL